MRIRLATKALPHTGEAPQTLDEVAGGVKIPWFELNGHKFEDFGGAQVTVGFGSHDAVVTRLTLDLFGPVTLVYLGKDGVEIGAVAVDAPQLPHDMDYRTLMPGPDELVARGGSVVEPGEPCRIEVSTTERMTDPEGPWVAWVDPVLLPGADNVVEVPCPAKESMAFGQTRGEAVRNLSVLLDA